MRRAMRCFGLFQAYLKARSTDLGARVGARGISKPPSKPARTLKFTEQRQSLQNIRFAL